MRDRPAAPGAGDLGIAPSESARVGAAPRWRRSALTGVVVGLALQALSAPPGAAQIPPSTVTQGEQIYRDQGCYGCHMIDKYGTPIAADLSHVGSKYGVAQLTRWLEDPQSQKPTAHMPKIAMSIVSRVGQISSGNLEKSGGMARRMISTIPWTPVMRSWGLACTTQVDWITIAIPSSSSTNRVALARLPPPATAAVARRDGRCAMPCFMPLR